MLDKYEIVTWKDVDEFIDSVVEQLNDEALTGVYGLPRGGLVFAVMLSHRLNVPLLAAPANNCLIVDDICDSGESLLHYVNDASGDKSKHYVTVTMYMKSNELVEPDIWLKTKSDKWVVFPWESQPE